MVGGRAGACSQAARAGRRPALPAGCFLLGPSRPSPSGSSTPHRRPPPRREPPAWPSRRPPPRHRRPGAPTAHARPRQHATAQYTLALGTARPRRRRRRRRRTRAPPAPARLTDALPLPRPTAPAKSTHLERSRYERRAHTEKGRLIRATPQNYRQPAALLVCLLSWRWRGVAHASPRRDVTRGGARARWAPSFGRKEEAGRWGGGGGGVCNGAAGPGKSFFPSKGRK